MTLVAAIATTLALLPAPSPSATARAAADHLHERGVEPRTAGRTLEAEDVRIALAEVRELLEEAGYGPDLALALTTVESEFAVEPSPTRTLGVVERRLRAFAAAADAADPAVPPDLRARAGAVLDDPIFLARPPPAGPFRKLMLRVSEWLGRVLRATASFAAANWRLILVFTVLALACALYFAARIAVRRLRAAEPEGSVRPLVQRGSSPAQASTWLELARREIAAGRRLEALRLMAAAALLGLRQRGLLPDEPGLTLLEALRHVRRSDVEPSFTRLVELHERQVYAGGQGASDELSLALELAESIVKPRVVTP